MDKEQIIAAIKKKVDLPDDIIEKAGGLLDGKSFVGRANKDDIVQLLVKKLKIDEGVANKIYEAVAGAVAGGVLTKIKDIIAVLFRKK